MPLPTGTVTFLFTDLEGSSRQWEKHPPEGENYATLDSFCHPGRRAGRSPLRRPDYAGP